MSKNLLVSCDTTPINLKEDYLSFFDKIIVLENYLDINKKDRDEITHWIVNPSPNKVINMEDADFFPNLECISSPSTGTTHISQAVMNYVRVVCLRDVKKEDLLRITASSEFTFLLFLNLVRRFREIIDYDLREWRNDLTPFRGIQVSGLKCLILGVGRIGSNLSKYLISFGASVYYFDPYNSISQESAIRIDYEKMYSMLSSFDACFVCFHHSKENDKFISDDFLSHLSKNSFFINTSRGENVDELCFTRLIESGHFSGVAIDVVSKEQKLQVSNNNLIKAIVKHKNGIVTPHIAGSTMESESLAFELVAKKMLEL